VGQGIILLPESLLLAVPETRRLIFEIEEILEKRISEKSADPRTTEGGGVNAGANVSLNSSVNGLGVNAGANVSFNSSINHSGLGNNLRTPSLSRASSSTRLQGRMQRASSSESAYGTDAGGGDTYRGGLNAGNYNNVADGYAFSGSGGGKNECNSFGERDHLYTVSDVHSRLKPWTATIFDALPHDVQEQLVLNTTLVSSSTLDFSELGCWNFNYFKQSYPRKESLEGYRLIPLVSVSKMCGHSTVKLSASTINVFSNDNIY
jgi:hypothetical protein